MIISDDDHKKPNQPTCLTGAECEKYTEPEFDTHGRASVGIGEHEHIFAWGHLEAARVGSME